MQTLVAPLHLHVSIALLGSIKQVQVDPAAANAQLEKPTSTLEARS